MNSNNSYTTKVGVYEASMLDEMGGLLDELYGGIKPRLGNLLVAHRVIRVYQHNKLLGFCTCYLNEDLRDKYLIGNYQSVDNEQVASLLLGTASELARNKTFRSLLGPMNGNTWQTYRFSTNTNRPFFLEHIHKPYYMNQWKNFGFEVCSWYCSNREEIHSDTEYVEDENYYEEEGLTHRPLNLKEPQDDLARLHEFCNRVFASNEYFSPIDRNSFIELYQPVLPIMEAPLTDLAFDNGKLVGFIFGIRNPVGPSEVILKTIARDPARKYYKLAHTLTNAFHKRVKEMGCNGVIHAYMHIGNKSRNMSRKFGGERLKDHVLLEMLI